MATYSTSLKLTLLADGEQSGVWGGTTNNNLGTLLEQAITGVTTITMVNANYTLTSYNGSSDEARNAVLVVEGTNSAVRQVIAPLVNKLYTVVNNTTGGYAITIGGATGSYVTIPNGSTMLVYCDGTDFFPGISYIPGAATSVETTNFTITQSGSNLVFQYNGANIITFTSAGNIVTGGSISATGSITGGA